MRQIRPPGRSEARATGALLMAGAGLVALSLILPHPAGGHLIALIATAAGMALVGAGLSGSPPPASRWRSPTCCWPGTALVTAVLIWESGLAVGQYGTIFTWGTLISAYFFSRRTAAIHLAWLLLVYAARSRWSKAPAATRRSPAGSSPPSRYRGDALRQQPGRPPRPRRRPRPPLLRPLPGHALHDGQTGALHRGQRGLGAEPRLPAGGDARRRLLDFTHSEDHAHATEEALRVFAGGVSEELETRVGPRTAAGTGCGPARFRAGGGTRLRPLHRHHRAQSDPGNARR